MTRELKNANITHVSYVDKGANQKKFFLTKSASEPTFKKDVKIITKTEDEQQLVYGVVYEPDVPDAHDDSMTADEIEKAAHKFLKDFRNIDTQHDFASGAGELVESYVAPVDMEVGDETISKGSWVIVTKATDEIWEQIKKGEFTGYSMAGTAETIQKAIQSSAPAFPPGSRIDVNIAEPHMEGQTTGEVREAVLTWVYGVVFDGMEDMGIHKWYVENELVEEEIEKSKDGKKKKKKKPHTPGMNMSKSLIGEDDQMSGFFNAMKSFFTGEKIQKGVVRDKYEDSKKTRNFWSAIGAFEDAIRSYNWRSENLEFEEDETKIREAIQDFSDIMTELLLTDNVLKAIGTPPDDIEKAGKKISGARMNKINAAFDALQELKNEVEEEEEEVKKEDIAKMLDDKLSPITKRLDAIEKEEGVDAEPPAEETFVKQFGDLLDEKLTPINDRLDAVEKARGASRQLDEEPSKVTKSEGASYMRHFG